LCVEKKEKFYIQKERIGVALSDDLPLGSLPARLAPGRQALYAYRAVIFLRGSACGLPSARKT
jgi:hypothetical protein